MLLIFVYFNQGTDRNKIVESTCQVLTDILIEEKNFAKSKNRSKN